MGLPIRRAGLGLSAVVAAIVLTSQPAWALPPQNPGRPTGVTATAGDGQATIGWADSYGETGYFPDYSIAYTDQGQSCTSYIPFYDQQTCTITGLTNGVQYVVRVRTYFHKRATKENHTPASRPGVKVTPEPSA